MFLWLISAEFALRPHLYLLLHALVGGPAALWLGTGPGNVSGKQIFYCRAVPYKDEG